MNRHFANSDDLCRAVAEVCPDICLSFSIGKDSIGAWLQLRKYFRSVRPFYMYLVPDLRFVEEALRYYEEFFDCKIVQLPHPSLYRILKNLVFQAPERCHHIEAAGLDTLSYDTCAREAMIDLGLPPKTFVAHGTRCCDSIMRRTSIKRFGSLNPKRRTFMCIYDWNADRLEAELRGARLALPVDYLMFGRSFDGIDERFLRPIKERFPADYDRILQWFPLADLELFRMEKRIAYAR